MVTSSRKKGGADDKKDSQKVRSQTTECVVTTSSRSLEHQNTDFQVARPPNFLYVEDYVKLQPDWSFDKPEQVMLWTKIPDPPIHFSGPTNFFRPNALHSTNFRGTIEQKKFAKSTSKEHEKGTGTKGRPVSWV